MKVLSWYLLDELKKVLARDKFKLSETEQDLKIDFITRLSDVTLIKSKFSVVVEDPTDDIVLRTAFDGNAKYVVSGDKHLLKIKQFAEIRIVSANEMLEILK
jgi:putative PIN family toxin of toxin-antitoxin system